MKKGIAVLIALTLVLGACSFGCQKKAPAATAENATVGSTVSFGPYEWIVLAREGNRALLLTKDVVAGKSYIEMDAEDYEEPTEDSTEEEAESIPDGVSIDESEEEETEETEKEFHFDEVSEVTWADTKSVRTWLNDAFLNKFSAEEQAKMAKTTIKTSTYVNAVYGSKSSGGETAPQVESTEDKIFLLSAEELKQYLTTDADRKCGVTKEAKEDGVYVVDGGAIYWLRTPGVDNKYVCVVGNSGSISNSGILAENWNVGIRPAVWIELD